MAWSWSPTIVVLLENQISRFRDQNALLALLRRISFTFEPKRILMTRSKPYPLNDKTQSVGTALVAAFLTFAEGFRVATLQSCKTAGL